MLIKFLKKNILFLFLFSSSSLFASSVDIDQSHFSLLEHSAIYLDDKDLTLKEIIEQKRFQPYHKQMLNTGVDKKKIWIKIELQNNTNTEVSKILLLYSNFLEHIHFYHEENLSQAIIKGQAHSSNEQKTLFHYYNLKLPANSQRTYYIKSYSNYVSVRFSLSLEDEKSYLKSDKIEQVIDIFLIGFIFALMLYSLFISAYIKDKSYFFYSLYLFVLLYDQTRFMGLAHLYYPKEWMLFDLTITISRIYALIIASSLFTLYFLDLKKYKRLWTIYWLIILISALAILFLDMTEALGMTLALALMLMLFLAVCNLFMGIYAYLQGEKQARLYILGFSIVFVSYLIIIGDIIGFITTTQEYPNTLLFTTAFEALILSLAFADRYLILQNEKRTVDAKLLEEATTRKERIEQEVHLKTAQLNKTIKEKELLLQEVHHRVKNNLQIILTMIQLQNKGEETAILKDLENRINTIAKTYEMLIIQEDIEEIEMQPYIESLLHDLNESFYSTQKHITLHSSISGTLNIKKAIYVGLIINEIITNSYKYAFKNTKKGTISIDFLQEKETYTLIIKDNGKGYKTKEPIETLGLQLVNTLVQEELNGTMEVDSYEKCIYIITF